jgi:hypothetical protein
MNDKVTVTGVKVDVIQVPKYLLANAKHATPVSFKILGVGPDNPLRVRIATVRFLENRMPHNGFRELFSVTHVTGPNGMAERTAVAGGDISLSDARALYRRRFDTYVKSDEFRGFTIIGKTSQDTCFEIKVGLEINGIRILCSSDPRDDDAAVQGYFGDRRLPAVDMGTVHSVPITPPAGSVFENVPGVSRSTLVHYEPPASGSEGHWGVAGDTVPNSWKWPGWSSYFDKYYWRTAKRLAFPHGAASGRKSRFEWEVKPDWSRIPPPWRPMPSPTLCDLFYNTAGSYWNGCPTIWGSWMQFRPSGLTGLSQSAYGRHFSKSGYDGTKGQFFVEIDLSQRSENYDHGTYLCENKGLSMGVHFYASFKGRSVNATGMDDGEQVMDLEKTEGHANIKLYRGTAIAKAEGKRMSNADEYGKVSKSLAVGAAFAGPTPVGTTLATAAAVFDLLSVDAKSEKDGTAEAQVAAYYGVGPDDVDHKDGAAPEDMDADGHFKDDTRFWSAYDSIENNGTVEKDDIKLHGPQRVEVGQQFRVWMTLWCHIQLPAHDTHTGFLKVGVHRNWARATYELGTGIKRGDFQIQWSD